MRILLLTAYFPPDTGSASHLYYELGKEFQKRGHEVVVVTNKPSYFPQGDMERYKKKIWFRELYDGISVIRIDVPKLPRHIPLARAIWQFLLACAFLMPILLIKKPNVILVYSPPITLGFIGWIAKIFRDIPFILNVQDLFPQSVIDMGLLKNRFFILLAESMEKFIYKRASYITVHSFGNREHVIKKGVKQERVLVIHNWVDTEFIKPGKKENLFSDKFNLNNKFIVSFAGVLGYSQDINVILESAKKCEAYKDIQFLIVGDGVQKSQILEKAKKLGSSNVVFLPMQPREIYPQILNASDVGLATLHSFVKTPVVPSKILSIMAAGIPVIASMDLQGDAPKIIEEAKCGYALPPENSDALTESILKLYHNPTLCKEMGENGRRYAEENFSVCAAANKYEDIFKKLMDRN